ncbi:MAG: hypothetical protein QOH51_1114 [Acidobacteriota bacterium]|jgi:uncharacterized damage-inducible protein DinB|nr:hypothetical protein [Acidobacteriota bacterium]
MNYNSVSEIFDEIDRTRSRLLQTIEGLTDEQQGFRPAPEKWSVAQLCEHLSIVERNVLGLVERILGKAEESGQARADGEPFPPVSIEESVEQTRAVKLNAPESVRPGDARPLADSLDAMRSTRAALHALRPRLERIDGHATRFPHPAWGPLNLYQWLLFIGAHEDRHIAQIEALKETMDVPHGENI